MLSALQCREYDIRRLRSAAFIFNQERRFKVNITSILYAFRIVVRCIALFAAICEWAAAF